MNATTKERFTVERDECVMVIDRDEFGAGATFVEWRGAHRQFAQVALDVLHRLNWMVADVWQDYELDDGDVAERDEALRKVRREIERRWTWLGISRAAIREAANR